MNEFAPLLHRLTVIILAALLVILAGCQASGEQSTFDPNVPAASAKGAQAPDFTLTDLDGDEVSLSDLRGQPVLLNFWTTW